jgi:hypothetical protein
VKRPFTRGRAGVGPPLPIILPLPAKSLGKSERLAQEIEELGVQFIRPDSHIGAIYVQNHRLIIPRFFVLCNFLFFQKALPFLRRCGIV